MGVRHIKYCTYLLLNQINMHWEIGCSGFHYPEWKKVFYPEGLPQSKWFAYYCEHFKTLELNVTFYRFPQLSTLQGWHKKSPADFIFSVKAPRIITHYQQFTDTGQVVKDFYTVIKEGLMEKTGCILFQLPGSVAYSPELLQKIIAALDTTFTNVLEVRHVSWWQQSVYDALQEHGIIFCSQSHPRLPDEVIANTSTVYYRFHGVPELYKSEYAEKKLLDITGQIQANNKIQNAFLYFNNTMGMAGINNARQAIEMVNGQW